MSHSEDEDDFLSADEDGFESQQTDPIAQKDLKRSTEEIKTAKQDLNSESEHRTRSIEAEIEEKQEGETLDSTSNHKKSLNEVETKKCNLEIKKAEEYPVVAKPTETNSTATSVTTSNIEHCDDDDEKALAERIRERNLKIARKFSAEIAKNIKASAPIPVKSPLLKDSQHIGFKNPNDIEYPSICATETGTNNSKISPSFLPPAPPPTPALPSSFNQLDDQQALSSLSASTSQYGWRLPTTRHTTPSTSQPGTPRGELPKSSAATTASNTFKSDQARLALDRLSEKLAQSKQSKNLFERVADDIKKVSIKSEDPIAPSIGDSLDSTSTSSALPSTITGLGSTLGGWGWSGASKLLSSASQVTSQMGSVLDSVLPQVHIAQDMSPNHERHDENADRTLKDPNENAQVSNKIQSKQTQQGDSSPGDPLVDFTLNAMESLGKKAFNVMTERDESGSLQLKGLGRPWEHLLNMRQSSSETDHRKQYPPTRKSGDSEVGEVLIERPANRMKDERMNDDEGRDTFTRSKQHVEPTEFVEPRKKIELTPTLKNRKRRQD